MGSYAHPAASIRAWWRRRRSALEGARAIYRPGPDAGSLQRGIAILQRRWPSVRSQSDAAPIFLLSAGWRSGSTLLQRQVMTSPEVLIWGEPYGHAALIDQLAYPLRCITETWPHDDWFDIPASSAAGPHQGWTANLYPPLAALLNAHLAWFDALFAAPARAAGFPRWGLKEIRLTSEHALYLRWVFPRAPLLLLYRNPYHAYRSYRRWRSWYLRWPDDPVREPTRFGRHWRTLVEGYLADHETLGGLLIRYEDLANGRIAVQALADHLGLAAPLAVTLDRIDSRPSARRKSPRALEPIPEEELVLLRDAVDPVATRLGYQPDDR